MVHTKFTPLGSRVLVKRREAASKTESGIYLPDNAQEKNQEAVVCALGKGGKDKDGNEIEFSVTVGDVVLIPKYGGTEVEIDGETHIVMDESSILGVIEGQSNK